MNNKPLVSVFMPVYNQEDFIEESIKSVLDQDYEKIEIIIGDDHSTDNTWNIIQGFQQTHSDKIIAFRNPKNLGITGNCNNVLKKCHGKYIAFFSGDDIYLPSKIKKQIEIMESDDSIIMSYHDVEAFDSSSNELLHHWNHGVFSSKPIHGDSLSVAKATLESLNSFIAGVSVIVRKESIPVTGYDDRIPWASDWLMWIDILNGTPNGIVKFIPDTLARYRVHSKSITAQVDKMRLDQHLTLAIIEAKYPNMIKSVQKALSQLRYIYGKNRILNKENKIGRENLLLSIFYFNFSLNSIYFLIASFFGIFIKRYEKYTLTTKFIRSARD